MTTTVNPKIQIPELNNPQEETMKLIKLQNQKIQNLYNELEEKTNIINQFQNQLRSFNNMTEENQILKHQLMNNKQDLNIQLENLKSNYESELKKCLTELSQKENTIKNLELNIEKYKNVTQEIDNKTKILENENKENSEKINKYILNEKGFQSRAKELVEIIKNQDDEILKLKHDITELINENKIIKDEAINLKSMKDKSYSDYQNLTLKNNDNENVIINMDNTVKTLKNKNYDLNSTLNKLNKDYNILKLNYEEAMNIINEKDNIITKFQNENKELISHLEKNNITYNNFNNNMNELLNYFYSLMKSSIQWADTYIGINNQIKNNDDPLNSLHTNLRNIEKEKNENSKILINLYEEFNKLIQNLYERINKEYNKYNEIIINLGNEKQELLVKLNTLSIENDNINNSMNKLQNENLMNLNTISNINSELENLKIKLTAQKNLIEGYEIDIAKFYDHFIDVININIEKLKTSEIFCDIFRNINLTKPSNNIRNQLSQVKEISFNFYDMSLCLMNELNNKKETIAQYEEINNECKELRNEINEVRKGYTNKQNSLNLERENLINNYEKEKNEEINQISNEFHIKNNQLMDLIKEKDEEIEKLNNDNNLLYSQYLLSEKNFTDYKNNRKDYDKQIQEKYEELSKLYEDIEKDNHNKKSELDLIKLKIKTAEDNAREKSNENEILKKRIQELNKMLENNLY